MGTRFSHETHTPNNKNKQSKTSKSKPVERAEPARKNLLSERIDDEERYQPKTKENIQVYNLILSKLYREFGDVPQESLHSIANEILATLKTDGLKEEEKKAEIDSLFQGSKPSSDLFNDLINLAKNITDYQLKDTEMHEETNAIVF